MKTTDYYMNLPYKIELEQIPPSLGGGYAATVPLLGKLSFVGDGETPDEAVASLRELMAFKFGELIKAGAAIPEPPSKDYSGKFMVRVPSLLHQAICEGAEESGVSMNMFLVSVLSDALRARKELAACAVCAAKIDDLCADVTKTLHSYSIEKMKSGAQTKKYLSAVTFQQAA